MTEYQINNNRDLIDLAYSLGQPVLSRRNGNVIDNLIPLKQQNAHPQSLSAKFGVKTLPFHTDGAYFAIPPKYIILRYIRGIEIPTPTILCDLSNVGEVDKKKLKYSIWKVQSLKSFYSSILAQDESFYRFDTCTMKPLNMTNDNSIFFSDVISRAPKETIKWEINKTVVIDNWKHLHNRPEVTVEEINFRTLQRIMIL